MFEAMVTGELVARRKPLTKSMNYPAHPEGWIPKRSILCQNTYKGLAIHFAFFRGFNRLVTHREHLRTCSLLPKLKVFSNRHWCKI
jgi:hypothetical protein